MYNMVHQRGILEKCLPVPQSTEVLLKKNMILFLEKK